MNHRHLVIIAIVVVLLTPVVLRAQVSFGNVEIRTNFASARDEQ